MVMESFVAIALATAAVGQTSTVTYQNTISTGLTYPARMAPTPGGGVYVTDPPMKLFAEYNAAGALVGTHTIAEGAIGIAVHTDGRIFVSRGDGKIGVYTAGFVLQSVVNPSPAAMMGPNDLAFDPDANWQCTGPATPLACCSGAGAGTCTELYAVDAGGHRVLVFSESAPSTWTFVRSWGMEGPGLGQYESPQAIAIDSVHGRVLVTDVDNFRVQVFDKAGIFLFKFGYRIMYLPTTEVAWFARSEGLAIDACGSIYVADALMGTVRAFSSAGKELNTLHTPAVGYGTGPGQLRVPCDIMINSGKLYVADTNNGAVQVYNVACTGASAVAASASSESREKTRVADRSDGSAPVRAGVPQMPDNPAEIVAVIDAGGFREDLDFNRDRVIDADDLEIAVTRFGAGTVEDFLSDVPQQVASHDPFVPPHITDIANRCGRCHSMDGAPGGMLTALGQENLCQSCHSAGKIAGSASIGAGSLANSHPWNEAADEGVSNGPLTGAQKNAACTGSRMPWECCTGAGTGTCSNSDLLLHLDSGKIRCGTCHDPHENRPIGACVSGVCEAGPFNGSVCKNNSECTPLVKFMREEIYHGEDHMASQGGTPAVYARKRMTVMDPTLCGECHMDIAAEWSTIGHADTEADPWSHYDWSMGNNWLCTGPGIPYAYCTGDGAGAVSSPALALCSGLGTPLACCTGAGTGTCTISNASCTGVQTPWQCCLGATTGNCIANSACTGVATPSPCCTGAGTGTCSNGLPAAMCTAAGVPEPCCSGPGAGSCSDRASCRQCHSGNGYRDYSQDFPDGVVATQTHRGSLRVIDCLVCHATHGESQDGKLLRIYGTVRLPTGQVYSGVGEGATCMACHNGRTIPAANPTSVSTPHYLNGAAMLEGINAVTAFPGFGPNALCTAAAAPWSCCTAGGTGTCTSAVNAGCMASGVPWPCCTGLGTGTCTSANCTGSGTPWACCTTGGTGTCTAVQYTLSPSNHTTNAGLNCTTCHMAPGPTSGPEEGKVGGHTFRLVDHEAVPPYENVAACNAVGCHSGLTTINRTASGDFDSDGAIEGVQDETRGLLDLLKNALYDAGASRMLVNANTGLAASEPAACITGPSPWSCCTGSGTGTCTSAVNADCTGAGVPWACCTGLGTGTCTNTDCVSGPAPLSCCTGAHTGPTCTDPDAGPTHPYWTMRRCSGGTRNGLACNGSAPTAPFDCPGGTCPQIVPTGARAATVINAIWNWEFVDNSGDLGVKNTGYAIGLQQIAYKGVTGSALPRLDLCTAPATPWACCTGPLTGTCPMTAYRYSPVP